MLEKEGKVVKAKIKSEKKQDNKGKLCKKLKLTYDSESEEDELQMNLFSDEEDDGAQIIDIINQETLELQDQIDLERETFQEGDYVLVTFDKKKGKPEQ